MATREKATPSGAPDYAVHQRWAIVVLLALASIVAYIDRVNLSVALIDVDFKTFFGLSNTDRGLANSAFFWSYAALQIPAGWLVDRYGSKRPIAMGFAVWSVLTAVTSLTTGFSMLFAIRMLLGVAEAVIHPASMRWIRFNFPEKQRGLAIGLFMSGSKFGPAIGAVLAAWLIESHGWRAMFFILGAGALLWLIPWLLYVKNDRATGSVDQSASAAAQAAAEHVPMRRLFASPVLWGTIIGTFCYMYFVYFCMTWMPAYFNEARHLSLKSSSLYTTFSFAGMAIVSILGGWAADRLIARGVDAVLVRKAFTITGFLLATTVLIGAMPVSLNVALFFSVLSLSGLGLATANYWALTQTLIPSGSIGRIVGIQNCAASLAGIVAPILTGWLVDVTGTFDAPIRAVSLFIAVGIAAYLFLVRKKYAPTAA
jgi:ACS family D-galactonate transporter-like MFS transporter